MYNNTVEPLNKGHSYFFLYREVISIVSFIRVSFIGGSTVDDYNIGTVEASVLNKVTFRTRHSLPNEKRYQ